MKLNVRLQSEQSDEVGLPLVLIHGLFGSLDNLAVLARGLVKERQIIMLDVRNHGLSPHSSEMHYAAMARDVLETLDNLGIGECDIVGHSMGGKIGMAVTAAAPDRVKKLVVIDIAPVAYTQRHHNAIFTALNAVSQSSAALRSEAAIIMRDSIEDESIIQFLLKSFHDGRWCFNVPVLQAQYENLISWQLLPAWKGPALFIRGELSPYLADEYRDTLLQQFPTARAHIIAGAGHWVHAEKPEPVLRAMRRFFAQ